MIKGHSFRRFFSVFLTLYFLLNLSNELNAFEEHSSLFLKATKALDLGKFEEAILELKTISTDSSSLALKNYYLGIAYNRIKDYKNAIEVFKASLLKEPTGVKRDLFYELGQAQYAMNDLTDAILSFKSSIKVKFKRDSSFYYIASSNQILEEWQKAKVAYSNVLKLPETSPELRQAATFQLAEVFASIMESKNNKKELAEKYVIPKFEEAYELNKNSPIAIDIKNRLGEIKRKFDLDPNIMKNGRVLPEKRWSANLTQKSSYDNNVTLSNGLPSVQATQKDSFIFDTNAQVAYKTPLMRRFTLSPDLKLGWKKHSDQASTSVHFNDSYTITQTILSTLEHQINNKPSSLLLDYEYNYTAMDRSKIHELSYYTRYHQLTIGEKFSFFSFGESSLRYKYKSTYGYIASVESDTHSLAADQLYIHSSGQLFMAMAQADFIRFPAASNQDVNSYLLFLAWYWPEIIPKFTFNLNMSVTFLDPINQKATRGLEKIYNPSFRLTRNATENIKATFGVSFTNKTSDEEASYAYNKTVSSIELRYDF